MASIDCKKFNATMCSDMRRHLDDNIREKNSHSNKNIDQNLTKYNSWIGCKNYEDMFQKMKKNISEIDAEHPPKRIKADRNVNVSFYMTCPQILTDAGRSQEFFESAYQFISDFCAEQYGQSYPCGMAVHRDEVHEYIDKGWQRRTSLEHGHMWVTPYAQWTDRRTVYDETTGKPLRDADNKIVKESYTARGLNCKNFLTRSFLIELQQEFDRHVFREFGIHYLTGEQPLHMTVEELKHDSRIAADIITRAEQERDKISDQRARISDQIDYMMGRQSRHQYVRTMPDGKRVPVEKLPDIQRQQQELQQQCAIQQQELNHLEDEVEYRRRRYDRGTSNYAMFCDNYGIFRDDITEDDLNTITGAIQSGRLEVSDLPLETLIQVSERSQEQIESVINAVDYDPQQVLESATVSNLINRVAYDTCKQLHDRGLIDNPQIAYGHVDQRAIRQSLTEKTENFFEQCRQDAVKTVQHQQHKRHRGR